MGTDLLEKYGGDVPRYTSYPTAPHFHLGIGDAAYRRWLEALPAAQPLSLYVHVPFCDSLCWFCGCHTKIVRRYEPVAGYLEVLRREVDLAAETLGAGRPLAQLHFGGGSPTIMAPADVKVLMATLRRSFGFTPETDFAVEVDPREVARENITAWTKAGLTRASVGVQDLNPRVQRAVNRVQSFEETKRVIDWLRDGGVRQVNIDLMYGLPYQTVEGVLATVERVLDLWPDRLAVFGYAHVPWMKRHQRLIPEDALPGAEERMRQYLETARFLTGAGFAWIGLDHFARRDDPLAEAQVKGALHRNFQGYTTDAAEALIGFGPSAIGSLPQGYIQNAVPMRDYAEAIGEGRFPVVRGIRLDDEDRLRRAVIERLMSDLIVDLTKVGEDHGVAGGHFAVELSTLAEMTRDGVVRIDGGAVTVTEAGRPFVRSVCAAFDQYLGRGKARHSRAV